MPNAHACPFKKPNLKLSSLCQELLKRVPIGRWLMRMSAPFSYKKRNLNLSFLYQELLKRVPKGHAARDGVLSRMRGRLVSKNVI